MKLSLEEVRSIALGAVRVEENEAGEINLYRFTKVQEEVYREVNTDFYNKSRSTSGVILSFKTNSKALKLSARVHSASSRKYVSFDLFVNGEYKESLDNFGDYVFPKLFTKEVFPLGEMEKCFSLGDGEKSVKLYMPWSVRVDIISLEIDDGATLIPVRPEKKMILWGDSITQGYDNIRSYGMYSTRLSEGLGAEGFNRGIAAEKFFAPICEAKEEISPDYITVAYGTNDWNKIPKDEFYERCGTFYRNLSNNYPDAKIFAISPIWRKDHAAEDRILGLFSEVEEFILDCVRDLPNVTLVPGFDLVSHDPDHFGDGRVHPNDMGNEEYGLNLLKKIKKLIEE